MRVKASHSLRNGLHNRVVDVGHRSVNSIVQKARQLIRSDHVESSTAEGALLDFSFSGDRR